METNQPIQQQQQEQQQQYNQMQQALPNATGALVLGILSIVFCFCYGVIGLVLGIIGLILANKAIKIYMSNPTAYSESSYKNVKAGKTCAIIGLVLSGIYIICIFIYIAAIGSLIGGGLFEAFNGGNF